MKQALHILVISLFILPQAAFGQSINTTVPFLSNFDVPAHKAYHVYKKNDQDHLGEILYLIELVKNSEYGFVRNGRQYNAKQASLLLSMKFKRNKNNITTTEGFIEEHASFSSSSGKPYKVVDHNGDKHFAREVLYNELNRLRDYESSFVRSAKLSKDAG